MLGNCSAAPGRRNGSAEDSGQNVATRLAAAHGVKAIAERGLEVDVLVNSAGYGITGAVDGSDRTEHSRQKGPMA
jgi:NAD(P)-dependent dehydrogenase (short-subunit alcohol dehydrogenase family)